MFEISNVKLVQPEYVFMKKISPILLILFISACATVQSVIKSTFPYTATLVLPRTTPVKTEQTAIGIAASFDQKLGNDGKGEVKIKDVRVISANLKSKDPSDFNIGNLSSVKIYISNPEGTSELMVASRKDITPTVGNSMVLDVDNATVLDELVKDPQLKIRMVYTLRNHINVDASLKLVISVNASPGK